MEDGFDHVSGLGYVQISDVHKSNITFESVNCTRRTVVYMACSELGESKTIKKSSNRIGHRIENERTSFYQLILCQLPP